jgi:hypothetical protein
VPFGQHTASAGVVQLREKGDRHGKVDPKAFPKFIYRFLITPRCELLGGKGANLAEMASQPGCRPA